MPTTIRIFISLLCVFICFAIMDAIWLGFIAFDWYRQEMDGLLRQNFITWPWVVFYLMYCCSVFILVVAPNRNKNWYFTAVNSALLGLMCYGTYNLTNYSILEGFTLKVMLMDWAWGVIITTSSGVSGWLGCRLFWPGQRQDTAD